MTQEHIDFTTPGGDTVTQALHKAEDNFNDLYGSLAKVVPYGGMRNLLINGDGRVNQLAFAGGALAANKYGYDQWRTLGSTSSITFGASTITLNGVICQVIETPDIANATVTVSVSNPTGPVNVSLQPDATTVTSAAGTIPAGGGIQSVTLNVPATLAGSVYLLLSTGASVSFDGSSKRAGIQVELGGVPSPFERRTFGQEFLLCQRYFEKSYDHLTAPGSVIAAGAIGFFMSGLPSATYGCTPNIGYRVPKRTAPAVTFYSPGTGVAGKARDNTAGVDVNVSAANSGTNGCGAFISAAGSASQFINMALHFTADARF